MNTMGIRADVDLQGALEAHAGGRRIYERGDTVFSKGTRCAGVFLVASGAVRLYLPSADGATMERVATAGCLLGLPATVSGEPYSLTAEAMEHAELIRISRASLTRLMQQDTTSALKLIGLLSGEVRTLRTEMAKRHAQRHKPSEAAAARSLYLAK